MGEQRGLAPLLTVDLAPVTVELNLRESGARFPCKWSSVLEIYNYERHIAWRSDHEVSLSELSEEQERQMYVLDEYPSEQTHFHVQGYDVAIENEDLANALTVLPDDKRDIVLLAYFLDMTDQEIADKLDMVRRTVQYKRAQSLKELKKEMEVTEDGAQSE